MPTTSNYYLDLEETKCTLNGKEIDNVTFTYKNGKVGVYGISEAKTKCNFYFKRGKYFTLISSSNIEEQDATLTNLINNGSFENGTESWAFESATTIVDTEKTHGNYSLEFAPDVGKADDIIYNTPKYDKPIINHEYYGRIMNKSTGSFGRDARFEWIASDLTGGYLIFAQRWGKEYPDWTLLSNIMKFVDITYVDKRWVLRSFSVDQDCYSYSDELMMIDLTDSYGDDIPSKEFLDNALMYFDDTVSIKTVVNSVGNFKVNQTSGVFECSEGASANIDNMGNVTINGTQEYSTCVLK